MDTTNKKAYPTGTISFNNWQTGALLAGPTTCTSTKDSSGNYACQASGSFTVNTALDVVAQYSGDTNYPATTTGMVQVEVNDFNLAVNPSSITLEQGQSQTTGVNIADLGAFNGTVSSFSCSGLPAETSCSFNPPQITGQGATTLTITTNPLGQSRPASHESRKIGRMATAMLFPCWGFA